MHYVYHLSTKKGRVMYVGCTANPRIREQQHKRRFKNRLIFTIVFKNKDKYVAMMIERFSYIKYFPKYNFKSNELKKTTLRDRKRRWPHLF